MLPKPQIQWSYRSTRDSEYAKFTVGKLTCIVQDMDGDASVWLIKDGEKVISESRGAIYDKPGELDHFEQAKEQAAAALIVEARVRGLYTD